MKFKIYLINVCGFFIFGNALGANLCVENEEVIFSFKTQSKKILSICKGEKDTYLTYRFGKKNNLELQFPKNLNSTSWKEFTFSGVRRGGGKENAGFGAYLLEFRNGETGYSVFQEWRDEEDTYSIGVTMFDKDRSITINGLEKSQDGSLLLLEEESKYIPNSFKWD